MYFTAALGNDDVLILTKPLNHFSMELDGDIALVMRVHKNDEADVRLQGSVWIARQVLVCKVSGMREHLARRPQANSTG